MNHKKYMCANSKYICNCLQLKRWDRTIASGVRQTAWGIHILYQGEIIVANDQSIRLSFMSQYLACSTLFDRAAARNLKQDVITLWP